MLKLNPDGTADIEYADMKVHIPAPTLSQFGELLDMLDTRWERLDETDTEREKLDARISEARESGDLDELAELRKESRQLEARARRKAADSFVDAVRIITEDAEAMADDPPAWAFRPDAIHRLINHFSTVPFLGPGGSTD